MRVHKIIHSSNPLEKLKSSIGAPNNFEHEIDNKYYCPVYFTSKIIMVSVEDIGKKLKFLLAEKIKTFKSPKTVVIVRADLLDEENSKFISTYMDNDKYSHITFVFLTTSLNSLYPCISSRCIVNEDECKKDPIHGDQAIYDELHDFLRPCLENPKSKWDQKKQNELNRILYRLILISVPIGDVLIYLYKLFFQYISNKRRKEYLNAFIETNESIRLSSKFFPHYQHLFSTILDLCD